MAGWSAVIVRNLVPERVINALLQIVLVRRQQLQGVFKECNFIWGNAAACPAFASVARPHTILVTAGPAADRFYPPVLPMADRHTVAPRL